MDTEKGNIEPDIPDWMLADKSDTSPVWFLDLRGLNLDLDDSQVRERINERLRRMLEEAAPPGMKSPAIIKTHVGEPKAWQRIIPEFVKSTIDFLRSRDIDRIVLGDATVLYSKGRGGRENPSDNIDAYMKLARDHGWLDVGVPFVVLDRAISSVPGVFEFSSDSVDLRTAPPNRFKQVRVGGAVPVAGSIVNHVHFTGHGLTGLALAVKGIGMGFADRRGKAQMHMAFGPAFDGDACDRCGMCATECPEGAIDQKGDDAPVVNEDICFGCGQCMSECPSGAIEMKPKGVKKWMRGKDSIHRRLVDYFIGMMNGRWNRTVHVAHMIRVTPSCDCLNMESKPMSADIGFIVGANPFAVDLAAERLLEETAGDNQEAKSLIELTRSGKMLSHVEKTYGLITKPQIKPVAY